MYVTIVHIHVKPDHVDDFIEAIRANCAQSILEPGNMRFDSLQSVDDPTRFVTYMAYTDEAAAKGHRETAHYRAFRDQVEDWMVSPRQNLRYNGIFPASD